MTAKQKQNDTFEETTEEELAKQEGRKPRLVPRAQPSEEAPAQPEAEELVAQRLPGMELPQPPALTVEQHADLTRVAIEYEKRRNQRMRATTKEVEAKRNLDAYLHSFGLDSFVYTRPDGTIMEAFFEKSENVKVRERRDEPAPTQSEGQGDEDADEFADDMGDIQE